MKVGFPRELLHLTGMPGFKNQLIRMAPDIDWLHVPTGEALRDLLLEEDACQPYKKMVRSALALAAEVDVLLLPRMVGIDGYLMCPNFRALPDIVRLNLRKAGGAELPVMAPLIDINKEKAWRKIVMATARELCERSGTRFPGLSNKHFKTLWRKDCADQPTPDADRTIALIGHPYVIADAKLNNGVKEILNGYGYSTASSSDRPFQELDRLAGDHDYYAKKLYWRSAREILGAFLYFSGKKRPAGIIHLVPFNCGVDALLRIELMRIIKQMKKAPPFMVLVCDQHTQRDHFITRIEAFLDIIDGIKTD